MSHKAQPSLFLLFHYIIIQCYFATYSIKYHYNFKHFYVWIKRHLCFAWVSFIHHQRSHWSHSLLLFLSIKWLFLSKYILCKVFCKETLKEILTSPSAISSKCRSLLQKKQLIFIFTQELVFPAKDHISMFQHGKSPSWKHKLYDVSKPEGLNTV